MNLLLLPKYGPLAASARQRFLQYIPHLEAHGVRTTVSPLLGDDYLAEKFRSGRAPARAAAAAILRRLRAILSARRYDLALLHYEAAPYAPAVLERLLGAGVPYVVDYDDAIFHNYDRHRSALVRRLLGHKIEQVIARSSGALCGSPYLYEYARRLAPRAALLPTVVDLALYPPAPAPRAAAGGRPFTIGWIGSPSTAEYLHALGEPLRALAAEAPLRFLCVGSGPLQLPGVPLELRPWREEREIADLSEMDVGVMPLPDSPWARGKCGFKLIQYMASFAPVVASPVGANPGIVLGEEGPAGLLADSPQEWLAALRRLRDEPALRARMGRCGRAAVEARYSLRVAAPRLLAFLREALDAARSSRGPADQSRPMSAKSAMSSHIGTVG